MRATMIVRSVAAGVLAVGVMVAAGCSSTFTKGTPIVEYQKGKPPLLQETPSAGEYVLLSSMMDMTAKATLTLPEGAPLGFKQGGTGRIIAVAGEKEFELKDGNYLWKRRP
jgi:hypothetical protein